MKRVLNALAILCLGSVSLSGQQNAALHERAKTAGEAFKNVQVLKRVPANQWFDTMAFIAGSLGVTCEHCHSSSFEIDEGNPAKLEARQMMRMVDEINQNAYNGKVVVTCNTCHHGSLKPDAAPVPDVEHWRRPAERATTLPSSAEVIARYRIAAGLETMSPAFTQSATFEVETYDGTGSGRASSAEVLLGPSRRIRLRERDREHTKTLIRNGDHAWANEGKNWRPMSEGEASTAFEAADLLEPDQVKAMAGSSAVFEDRVRNERAYVVPVDSDRERRWLFFDTRTGLLLRQRIFFSSFYADGSVDIDYLDYKKAGGLQLPTTFYVVNAGGAGLTIRRARSRKTNVRLDESWFRPDAG